MPHSTLLTDETQRLTTNALWLAKLRWVAVVGQLLTILVVRFLLGVDVDLFLLGSALSVTALSNFCYVAWLARCRSRAMLVPPQTIYAVLGSLALLDLMVLTVMLGATGGPTNPFVIFYFVNVALSAVLLTSTWAWTACAVSIVAIGVIYFVHSPMEQLIEPERLMPLKGLDRWPLAIAGEFIAFVACATVIVSFLTRLTSELRLSEQRRRRAEQLQARSEKFEALGTLAAGAAHELATPLSTIAVVAGEVAREIESREESDELIDDMRLIRNELDRCRAILDRMAIDSGQMIAELPRTISTHQLCEEMLAGLPAGHAERVDVEARDSSATLTVPVVATSQALRGVLHNALDADPIKRVEFSTEQFGKMMRLSITDHGPGMDEATLARLGEPFFTTKSPGRGMGLGWFLARSVVERLDGSIDVESSVGRGTRVVIELPLSAGNEHSK